MRALLSSAPDVALAFDLEVLDLPDGWSPLELVAIIRCLDDQGLETAVMRTTDGLQDWEVVGLLRTVEYQILMSSRWEDEE